MPNLYDQDFYRIQQDGSRRSAAKVVPLLQRLLRPRSVVDVGCGLGTWMAAFGDHQGVEVLGLDGPHVDPALLHVPAACFHAADLAAPIVLDRRFDLTLSVEVAEHLPAERAAGFVADLCRLAPVVVFAAALPFQGGTGHVHENWPEYWAQLFRCHGYGVHDVLRPPLWLDPEIEWWYRQNLLLFIDEAAWDDPAQACVLAESCRRDAPPQPLTRIHPVSWLSRHLQGQAAAIVGDDVAGLRGEELRYFTQLSELWLSGRRVPPPPRPIRS
ncbi:MAG: class I SAM-dependent methyltransferase [Magnetospirillum sp.]